jgi:hypothetical protein
MQYFIKVDEALQESAFFITIIIHSFFHSANQIIRYGLVARICRSHQSSSLSSAGKARVRVRSQSSPSKYPVAN